MAKKISKKELTALVDKLNKQTATPEEKLKLLRELNDFIEKANGLMDNLIGEMKKQLQK